MTYDSYPPAEQAGNTDIMDVVQQVGHYSVIAQASKGDLQRIPEVDTLIRLSSNYEGDQLPGLDQ